MMNRIIAALLFVILTAAGAQAQFVDQRTWGGTAAIAGGDINQLVVTIPNYDAHLPGVSIRFRSPGTNTGATTVAISGLAPVAVRKIQNNGLAALTGNEIVGGQVVTIVYDGTFYQIIGQTPHRPSTRTVITSVGTATYTTPAGAITLKVRMIAGGGGGGGTGSPAGTSGANGEASGFSTVSVLGGQGGTSNNQSSPGGGGAGGTGGSGAASLRIGGGNGSAGIQAPQGIVFTAQQNWTSVAGGNGPFGGAGGGVISGVGTVNAEPFSGAGGGGGIGLNNDVGSGGSGAAGEYAEINIGNPAVGYSYTVGAGGAAGTGNVSGAGTGASGIIIIDEFYQ